MEDDLIDEDEFYEENEAKIKKGEIKFENNI